MRKYILITSAMALSLSACAQETSDEALSEVAPAEYQESGDVAAKSQQSSPFQESAATMEASTPPSANIAPRAASEPEASDSDEPQGHASMPEFTYVHEYRFEAPSSDLGQMQDAHVAACDAMGPQQCRLANYSQDLNAVSGAEASLELYVASDKIRDLTTKMSGLVDDFGGKRTQANITGTDTTQQFDQAQLQVKNLLAQMDRLQAIIDDRRSTQAEKRAAAQQLAAMTPRLNADQKRLDRVASEIGFTKMDVHYASSSLFGPWMPYALVILLIAVIGGLVYRAQQTKVRETVPA